MQILSIVKRRQTLSLLVRTRSLITRLTCVNKDWIQVCWAHLWPWPMMKRMGHQHNSNDVISRQPAYLPPWQYYHLSWMVWGPLKRVHACVLCKGVCHSSLYYNSQTSDQIQAINYRALCDSECTHTPMYERLTFKRSESWKCPGMLLWLPSAAFPGSGSKKSPVQTTQMYEEM